VKVSKKGILASTSDLKAHRLDLALDNLAEMVAGSALDSEAYFDAGQRLFEERRLSEALSDSLRVRLVEASTLLAQVEVDYPKVWQHNDWRETCDAMTRRLESHGEVTPEWLKTQFERLE
jgi:hypothetical protein